MSVAESSRWTQYERRVYSQNGEDGVLEQLFREIGPADQFAVEFGVGNGLECNSRYLKEHCGWRVLWMDAQYENVAASLFRETIHAENAAAIFARHQVPPVFDLLSIDVDYNDFYIWRAISAVHRPRVVVIEYNATWRPHEDRVVVYDPAALWDGTNYHGASMFALQRLGRTLGYSLIHAEASGVNLFFLRDDQLSLLETPCLVNDVPALYRPPHWGGHPADPRGRPWVCSLDL